MRARPGSREKAGTGGGGGEKSVEVEGCDCVREFVARNLAITSRKYLPLTNNLRFLLRRRKIAC